MINDNVMGFCDNDIVVKYDNTNSLEDVRSDLLRSHLIVLSFRSFYFYVLLFLSFFFSFFLSCVCHYLLGSRVC